MIEIRKTILKEVYKKRPASAKKYDFGLLIIIGGGEFYTGSPALTGLAAFRAGCDMVHIIAPKRAADVIASFSPNLAAFPLEGKILKKEHLSTLLVITESAKEVSRGKTAVVIGGGLGRSKETRETVLEYLKEISIPAVIDADAIYAISEKPEILKGKPFLVTPHSYEFYILTGKKLSRLSEREKIELVKKEARRLGITILLKGKLDIAVVSDGKKVALNKTGTPAMTVGGTGDTLAGIAGALLARGVEIFNSACAAAFINGKAGRLAEKEYGEGLLATDLIEKIPEVLLKI